MKRFKSWLEQCQRPGSDYEGADALPNEPVADLPVSAIAYYLPQFHRIPQNDAWWGEGFTEWSNVTRAVPRYVGHYQPRSPGALGFYDLSDPAVLKRQCALARRGGIAGFCFHYYWFSGETLLDTPIRNLLADPAIDIRFCLDWANENWTRRWDGGDSHILMRQRYAPEDARGLAEAVLPMLRDRRYIRLDGRPLMMIYRPDHIPDPKRFTADLRRAFIDLGQGDPFLIAPHAFDNDPVQQDLDGTAGFPPHGGGDQIANDLGWLELLDLEARGGAFSYDRLIERMLQNRSGGAPLFPGVCPSWDNEARRGVQGVSFHGATPAKYGWWLHRAARQAIEEQAGAEKLVFVNAWNEWAEGAYLEPDRHFGYAYLAETRRALERVARGEEPIAPAESAPVVSKRNAYLNRSRKAQEVVSRRIRSLARQRGS